MHATALLTVLSAIALMVGATAAAAWVERPHPRRRRRPRAAGHDPRPPAPTPATPDLERTHPRSRLRIGCAVAATVLVVSIVAAGAVAWGMGWRIHAMTTPSMGTAAPVGSLVISRPIRAGGLHHGQIIVFHPPGRPGVTFAHRVYAIATGPGGVAIHTKGDINPTPDVWTLHQADLIGSAVTVIPDLGFVVQMLPLLLMGTFLILLVTSGLTHRTRGPARTAGASILVAFLLIHFRPLERVDLLDEQVTRGHGIATVVPTGILPIRATAQGGSAATVRPGQVGVVHLDHVGPEHLFRISTSIHLSGWWWLTLLGWAVPLLVSMGQKRMPGTPIPVDDRAATSSPNPAVTLPAAG